MLQNHRGAPPVSALIRRDGRGSLTLDLWLPPPPPPPPPAQGGGADAAALAAALAAAVEASKKAAETPSGEVPSIAAGASPEQRRLWFADLLFNREREFFARLASEAAAAIEGSAPAWQVPVAALLRRLDEIEERENAGQRQERLEQQLGGVGISGGQSSGGGGGGGGGSVGTASSASAPGSRPFKWPKELCSSESNAASAAAASAAAAAAAAGAAAAGEGADPADTGASSPPPRAQTPPAAAGKNGGAPATATATTTTPSMALLLRAECLSHIPHMRIVSAQIGGEFFKV